ncbi:MAG: hypothetical protein R2753_10695 [Chitinophagales bacterium]
MFALIIDGSSLATDLVEITDISTTLPTATIIQHLTSSGTLNLISTFDSERNLYIFQAEQGCGTGIGHLVTVDIDDFDGDFNSMNIVHHQIVNTLDWNMGNCYLNGLPTALRYPQKL